VTTTARLDTTARLELMDLYARYSRAFDDGDAESVARLFTEDGSFTREGAPPVRGRAALVEMARAAATRAPGNRHIVSGALVEPSDGGATGTAYVLVLNVRADAVSLVAMGRYHDQFVLEDGSWRIRSRHFVPFTGPGLAGTVLATVAS